MSYPYSVIKTAVTGDLLAASDYNAEHQNHINNNTPSTNDDASANLAAMQVTVDPYPAAVASLASTLEGELHRIRYMLAQITGKTNWYEDPDSSIALLYGLNPTGTLHPFAGAKTSIPSGYLYCDGTAVSRSSYAGLFAVIGTKWGSGDGATTFHLPDMRGRFARGQDDGTARDVDAASRTACNAGGNTGDNVGTIQTEAYKSHTHTQDAHTHTVTDPGHFHTIQMDGTTAGVANLVGAQRGNAHNTDADAAATKATGVSNQNATATNQNSGGNETRPINAAVVWIIKV
jgi:microcystin-dependent protein